MRMLWTAVSVLASSYLPAPTPATQPPAWATLGRYGTALLSADPGWACRIQPTHAFCCWCPWCWCCAACKAPVEAAEPRVACIHMLMNSARQTANVGRMLPTHACVCKQHRTDAIVALQIRNLDPYDVVAGG